ncbi:MAG: hypothetical protein ACRDVE_02690 [Actinocrinis sp.]
MRGASLVDLVAAARYAGVRIERTAEGPLGLKARERAARYARALRQREADVLALYDWTHADTGDPKPCALCGKSAILRDPVERRPCHKVCSDRLLSGEAVPRQWITAHGGAAAASAAVLDDAPSGLIRAQLSDR